MTNVLYIHVQLYSTCTVHVLYMYSTCIVHVQYMYSTCTTQYIKLGPEQLVLPVN